MKWAGKVKQNKGMQWRIKLQNGRHGTKWLGTIWFWNTLFMLSIFVVQWKGKEAKWFWGAVSELALVMALWGSIQLAHRKWNLGFAVIGRHGKQFHIRFLSVEWLLMAVLLVCQPISYAVCDMLYHLLWVEQLENFSISPITYIGAMAAGGCLCVTAQLEKWRQTQRQKREWDEWDGWHHDSVEG